MGLYQVITGAFINAQDIDQLVQILQRPSGSQETGKYFLTDSSYVIGASVGDYVGSQSRGATPVSVSIDTSDQVPTNCNPPSTDHLTSNGFRVVTTSTAVAATMTTGGSYTIAY